LTYFIFIAQKIYKSFSIRVKYCYV
jgi:hypothetical protein